MGHSQGRVSANGVVSGPGTGTSDSIAAALFSPRGVSPVAISAGESILNARATDLLGIDRIKSFNRGVIRGFAKGMVPAAGSVPTPASQVATTEVNTSTRIINVIDPEMVEDYMSSSSGEKVILNTIQRNPGAVKQYIS